MEREPSRSWAATIFAVTPTLVLFADLAAKEVAFRSWTVRMGRTVIPGILSLRYSENTGAVFGIGQGMRSWLLVGTAAAVVVILWVIHKHPRGSALLSLGLGLLLGGALGNAWDRLMLRVVRDFVDLHVGPYHWPTFNIADIAICIGAALVAVYAIRQPRHLTGD